MRKAVHITLGVFRVLALIGIGAGLLGLAVGSFFFRIQGNDPWLWLLEALQPRRGVAAVGGAALIALELAFQFTRPRRTRYRKSLTTRTKEGEVTVDLSAVQNELSRLADAYDSVVSLDPVILPKKNAMDVELDLRIRGGSQVPELCKSLQDAARQTIVENLGVFQVDQVRINIRELVREARTKDADVVEDPPPAEDDDGAHPPTRVEEEA